MMPKLAIYDSHDDSLVETCDDDEQWLLVLGNNRRSTRHLELILEETLISGSFSAGDHISRMEALFSLYLEAKRLGMKHDADYVARGHVSLNTTKKRWYHRKPRARFQATFFLYRNP